MVRNAAPLLPRDSWPAGRRWRQNAFGALPEDGDFDNPLGESTGAAQLFGASGGVMEAMVRTAAHFLGEENSLPLEWHQFRGVDKGVKTAAVPGLGKVAICNGIAAAQRMLESESWREEFVAIEVMACVGGCLGGGGEPKSMDPLVLEKRMQAIYEVDRQAPRRRSYENQDVLKLYATEFKHPNSTQAHSLLHTSYAARNSKRLLLMRFLDFVDRRDGSGAAKLFHPDASWSTASPLGDIHGAANIEALIVTHLPPRKYGPGYARHRMESPADIDDLRVITPAGERCRFSVEVDTLRDGGRSRMVIRKLVRENPAIHN
jgi:NADH-quinone oxidoreductase subunit G